MARVRIALWSRRRVLAAMAASPLVPACEPLFPRIPGLAIEPITPNGMFYVTSCCGTPSVDPATWRLTFTDGGLLGEVDLAWLESLPVREKEHTLQCIGASPTNLAIGNAIWSGLPLVEVLEAAGVSFRQAVQLVLSGADGYQTSIPYDDLPNLWLVWWMNGEPLPPAHGFPARLLVPGRYGTKNVKWLVDVALADEPFVGFWEESGWSDAATYLANGLIGAPADGDVLEGDEVRVIGTAFAGRDPIARVDVSDDGGETWQDATITYAGGPDVWALWEWIWRPPEAGRYVLKVRVTTEGGATSAPGSEATNALAGYDGSMEVDVRVR